MPKSPNQKLKLLVLMNYLLEETDEEHAVPLAQLQEELERCGISAERKSVYDDLDALRRWGLDVKFERGRGYFIASREFELPELKLLVDAVQSSRFITQSKTLSLIRKIEGLCSVHEARLLQRQVYVAGRVKTMNESVYYNVDELSTAISGDRQISFRYFNYGMDKSRQYRHGGARYEVSPFALIWDDENYYLLAWDERAARMKHYRVDKMSDIELLERARRGKEHFAQMDMSSYAQKVFGMFAGEVQKVWLRMEKHLVGAVVDRFGRDVPITPDGEEHFTVTLDVVVSPQFYAWVFGFGTGAEILAPASVRRGAAETLQAIASRYQ